MCKKSFTFKLIKGESNCVLSLGFAELSNNTHILQLLGEIIKIEPNEKCKLLFIGKKRAKITLEDIYYLSNLEPGQREQDDGDEHPGPVGLDA